MSVNSSRPGRPFGLSLAIVASALVFSVMPLIEVGFAFYLHQIVYGDQGDEVLFSGLALQGFSVAYLMVRSLIALSFLAIVVLAWRGRPAWARGLFMLSVLLLGAVQIGAFLLPVLTSTPHLSAGIDSSQGAQELYAALLMGMIALTMLFSLWFGNRWSVRAYFRGYYTADDLQTMRALGLDTRALEAS